MPGNGDLTIRNESKGGSRATSAEHAAEARCTPRAHDPSAAEISISDFFPASAISEITDFFLPTPAIYGVLDCTGVRLRQPGPPTLH